MKRRKKSERTYSVATWDHEAEDWHEEDGAVTKWGLRVWIRRLLDLGYDEVSVSIHANGPPLIDGAADGRYTEGDGPSDDERRR
jgi:hypothetical protein